MNYIHLLQTNIYQMFDYLRLGTIPHKNFITSGTRSEQIYIIRVKSKALLTHSFRKICHSHCHIYTHLHIVRIETNK